MTFVIATAYITSAHFERAPFQRGLEMEDENHGVDLGFLRKIARRVRSCWEYPGPGRVGQVRSDLVEPELFHTLRQKLIFKRDRHSSGSRVNAQFIVDGRQVRFDRPFG